MSGTWSAWGDVASRHFRDREGVGRKGGKKEVVLKCWRREQESACSRGAYRVVV